MTKPVVAIAIGRDAYPRMFNAETLSRLGEIATVEHHDAGSPAHEEALIELLATAQVCLSSWGVAPLSEPVVNAARDLELLVHMGGSVKRSVTDDMWSAGIRVASAGSALARDVAETTLGLMIVGRKRIWPLAQHVAEGGWRDAPVWAEHTSAELHGSTVGIVGASRVGRAVIELLKPFGTRTLVHDPFLSNAEAAMLGVEVVDLATLVRESQVVSLHCPENPDTAGMLDATMLSEMPDGAVLINTARGGLIDQSALVAELESGRIFAFLDVTDPEPPAPDDPIRSAKNVIVTPHIAGCISDCSRMGSFAVDEIERFIDGRPLKSEVTEEMLGSLA